MKNRHNVASVILAQGSMEQPLKAGYVPFHQEQQQSKSGIVSAVGGSSSALAQIATADPLRATVGALSVLAVKAVDDEKCIIAQITNDLALRQVWVGPAASAGAAFTEADAVSGTDAAAVLTFDDGELNNAPISNSVANGTGLSTAINAAIATRKPSFSLASIINAIEDIVLADTTKDALVICDQTNATIKVLTGVPAQIAAAADAATGELSTTDIQFEVDATPAATAARLFGE